MTSLKRSLKNMQIRRYNPGEEEEIWEIVSQATRISNARDYHPDLINRWAPKNKDMDEWADRMKQQSPFVAIIDSQIVGMAELESNGFIDYFYVHPDFQGRGVGKALLKHIESEVSGMLVDCLFCDVSLTARPFFESQSFVVTEARQNIILGHSAPNFAMEKHLSEQGSAHQSTTAP